MKKAVILIIVMCFMATCPATSQVNKPVKRQQKPKTEQNQSTKSSNGASSSPRNN